ncbi:MAG: hypothetical protein F4Z55_02765 [Boseongicola sp. SB0667_bin_21]|nr:hypothetical protein [Boseongicola sp. SB0667_bin_21]
MSEFLPKEVREGLELARKRSSRRRGRLNVRAGDRCVAVLRCWESGFAIDAENSQALRGLVDLYDGGRHLSQCLIVASREDADERVYEFKRATPASDRVPLDYEWQFKPFGLITHRPAV